VRWVLVLLVAGCGGPVGDEPLRVTADVSAVELGKAFPLTVVRTWARGEDPPEWDDGVLETRLVETGRREDGGRIEETLRYAAYAFAPGAITEPVELSVEPIEAGGPPELPGELPGGAFPWWIALLAAPLLLLLRRRRARPPAPEPPPSPPPAPHLIALERLRRMREDPPEEPSEVLRDYVGERFHVPADVMTTEQLVGVSEPLRNVLPRCDVVKYAGHRPAADERLELLDAAEAFVRETA